MFSSYGLYEVRRLGKSCNTSSVDPFNRTVISAVSCRPKCCESWKISSLILNICAWLSVSRTWLQYVHVWLSFSERSEVRVWFWAVRKKPGVDLSAEYVCMVDYLYADQFLSLHVVWRSTHPCTEPHSDAALCTGSKACIMSAVLTLMRPFNSLGYFFNPLNWSFHLRWAEKLCVSYFWNI